MKASIIISSYNQSHTLFKILDQISKQKTSHEYEVIITDDGSSEKHLKETFNVISRYPNMEVRFVYQQDNGFRAAKARNNAIRLAKNDVIVTLDGDIIPEDEHWLQKTMDVHKDKHGIVTYTHRHYRDFNEMDKQVSADKENRDLYEIEQQIKLQMRDWQRAWSFNISFRKTDNTYFDENFKYWGLEDGEFTYRLMKKFGYKLHEIKDTKVTHINEDGAPVNNPFRTKKAVDMLNFIENAIYFYKKYEDDEILQTFNTIPNYDQFIKGFDLSDTVGIEMVQTIENLEKQRDLYKAHIAREQNYGRKVRNQRRP